MAYTKARAMKRLLLASLILAACGDNIRPPMTFGDGAQQIAEAFCGALVECGVPDIDEQFCIDNEVFHLCSDRWDCEEDILPEEEAMFEQCANDLLTWDCRYFLPASCYAVLEL